MANREFDIVIVGGGIAGSALACALGDTPYRVALIEGGELGLPRPGIEAGVTHFDPRVSALGHAASVFLSRLGVWPAMESLRVSPYSHMHVWDAQGTGSIDFDATAVHQSRLGHIVENRVTVWALRESMTRYGNIVGLGSRRVTDLQERVGASTRAGEPNYALLLDDGTCLEASLVVAADGALSSIRSLAGLTTREWDYDHVATVATVKTQLPHQDTAWQRFLPEGPLAFLPLGKAQEHHFCSIVWSAQPALAQRLAGMDDRAFCRELGAAFEHRLGRVLEVGPRSSFPLRQRHATRYYQAGLALVGDAAHSIHPLAGQGINLGLQDVDVLAQELSRAADHGIAPGEPGILARFQRRRLAENLGMMAAMEGFKRLFGERDLRVRWLRNTGMDGINRLPWVKQQIMRRAMGL